MVARAMNKVKEYLEAANIPVQDDVLREQLEDWYWNSDIADIDTLAACVIEYGHYDPGYTQQDMLDARIVYAGSRELQLRQNLMHMR